MRFSLPLVGLEPTHLTAQVPKTCMSTNFITRAWTQLRYPYITDHTKAVIRCQVAVRAFICRSTNVTANPLCNSI